MPGAPLAIFLALAPAATGGAPGALPPALLPSGPQAAADGSRPAPPPAPAGAPAAGAPAVNGSGRGSYTLRREGDGYVHRDARFVARVASDGSVRFSDVHGKIGLPLPLPLPLPQGTATLEGTLRNRLGQRRRAPARPLVEPWTVPPQTVTPERPGTSEVCTYRTPCFSQEQSGVARVAGTFDLTDEIMRLIGDRPYSQEKARFLAATAGFRANLAAEHAQKTLRQALHRLPEVLAAVWSDRGRTGAERRRILYLLWAELDTTTAGGRQAATTIEEFIRQELPRGSPAAFTAAELRDYGAPTSDGRRFAPYER